MIDVNDEIKQAYDRSTTQVDKIILDGQEYRIKNVDFYDDCYEEGNIFGTAIAKGLEFEIENTVNLEGKEVEYLTGIIINSEIKWISLGNFIIQDVEPNDTTNIVKVTAMDYMLKSNTPYVSSLNYGSGRVTLLDVLQESCTNSGLTLKTMNFTNSSFIVDSNQFTEETLNRQVIQAVAQISGTVAKIRNNDLYLIDPNKVETSKVFTLNNYEEAEIKRNTHPINLVSLGMADIEGENITLRDEESIKSNGENSLVINDNPFAYTQEKREQLITALFNSVKGFEYKAFSFKCQGLFYLETMDKIQFLDKERNAYNSYIFRFNYKSPNGLESTIEAPSIIKATVNYQNIPDALDTAKRTEILVNKQNQTIESVVSQVGEQNTKINQMTQTVDELNSKIGEVADVTITGESYNAQVFLEGINASEPILIKIRPYLQSISALYPSKSLYPGKGIYPRSKPKLIFFDRDNNNMWTYILPDNLNYIDENTYDEFLLDYENQICSVTKRVGIDENGALYKLDIPYSTQYDYPTIALEDGNYSIYLDNYSNGYLFVKLMSANIYTSQFATKVELNSEIKQTKSEIDLSVSEKLTSYPTTQEMNSSIKISANEINSEVSKKVGEDEIISKINQSAEAVSINANRININGTVSANGNFKIDTNGNMIANNGTFNGGTVNVSDNGLSAYEGNIRAKGNTFTNGLYSEGLVIRKNNSPTNRVSANSIFLHMYDGEPRFTMTGTSREITRITDSGMNFMFENDVGFSVDGSNRQAVLDGITNFYSTAPITVTSLKDAKKNFEKLENALDIVKATDIYKYNLKNEEDTTKKHIGFVIGDDYNYSEEITSKNNDGVDIYSMVSVCMKAIQEQQEQIEKLQQEIKELKGEK